MWHTRNGFMAVLLAVALGSCGSEAPTAEIKAPEVVEVLEYHDNGMLSIKGTSIDGKRSGLWQSYYPNGLKWSETTFKDGLKEGPTVAYFPNGVMRYTGRYYDDQRAGNWIFYDTLGTVELRVDMDVHPGKADSLLKKSPVTP